MLYPITKALKTYVLAGLVVLVSGGVLGKGNSSFAEAAMDSDIFMTIDTRENFGGEAEMFNNVLNVFTAAFLATNGNLEIVAMDRHTICISARPGSGGCPKNDPKRFRHVATDSASHDAGVTIISNYDQ